jgi:hypothetical protein
MTKLIVAFRNCANAPNESEEKQIVKVLDNKVLRAICVPKTDVI